VPVHLMASSPVKLPESWQALPYLQELRSRYY
jgi:hypothetical protein